MTRMLKTLGVALVAVFAMSAVAASAASAQSSHEFKNSAVGGDAILTGNDDGAKHLFRNTPGATPVECNATFSASATEEEVDTLTVKPSYTNCSWEGNAAAVRANGCAYNFDSDTDANGHAAVEVECEQSTESIEVEISGICTIKFAPQVVDQGVHYNNEATSPETVTAEATATGIDFTKSSPGSFCFLVTGGTTGTYNGNSTLKAYAGVNSGGTATTPGTTSEGSQVNATVTNP